MVFDQEEPDAQRDQAAILYDLLVSNFSDVRILCEATAGNVEPAHKSRNDKQGECSQQGRCEQGASARIKADDQAQPAEKFKRGENGGNPCGERRSDNSIVQDGISKCMHIRKFIAARNDKYSA